MATVQTGIATEFIQFTRASNATVTDSDGKIKWAPHNLLTNSESFDAAAWGKTSVTVAANSVAAPNGTTTADRVTGNGISGSQVLTQSAALPFTRVLSVFAKAGTHSFIQLTDNQDGESYVNFNLSTGAVGTAGTKTSGVITPIGSSGWYLCQATMTSNLSSGNQIWLVPSASASWSQSSNTSGYVDLWGAHLYRSDLGGMQPNTSAYPMYNPTTPKNLLGYTEDFGNWVKSGIAAFGSGSISNEIVAPNGLQTADRLVENTVTGEHFIYQQFSKAAVNGIYTMSAYAKLGPGSRNFALGITNGATGGYSCVFNLTTNATTVAAIGVPTGFTAGTPTITPLSNSWFRVSFTVTTDTATRVDGVIYIANGTTLSYAGGNTSGIYLWGAQLSDSASLDPYVPVYGAAVTSAAYYGPRRDFDPVTLACKGLLVEEQRTNIVLNSNVFDAAVFQTTVTSNAAISPSGLIDASSLFCTSTSGRTIISTTLTNTISYVLSVFIKAGTNTSAYFEPAGNASGSIVVFNLSNGTITSGTGGSITPAPNGYYRCSATFTATSTGASDLRIGTGDATSKTIFVYGLQIEAGSFATSYIPVGSTTAGATRLADVASVSTQAFPYNATEGSVVINLQHMTSPSPVNQTHWQILGAANILGTDRYQSATNIAVRGLGINVDTTKSLTTNVAKVGTSFTTTEVNLLVNGGTAYTNTSASGTLSGATSLQIGNTTNLYQLNGWVRQLTYLPRKLSVSELQTRTA